MIRESSTQQLRQHLGEVLNTIHHSGDPVVITRSGKRVAALIDIEQFERIQRMDAEFDQSRSEIVTAFSGKEEHEGVSLIDEAIQVARRELGHKTRT